jgi:hypothetical protein
MNTAVEEEEACCSLYLTDGVHRTECLKYTCTWCMTSVPGHYTERCDKWANWKGGEEEVYTNVDGICENLYDEL